MKVWIGYQCYYDYCNEWRDAVKVFDDEVKALIWKEEVADTQTEYRNYTEFTVE
jgi:hypothetical protein